MKHTSIKLDTPCEFINIIPVNPLISKCQIKVCYVGEEPNRNKSVITKETAEKMAQSLPGSPIVGFFNQSTQDFEEHNKSIVIQDGKFSMEDNTRPYGFVDLNAKVWFQKFLDDGINEREYLMTEGYLWTGQYPEAKRIIDEGNNQSMELDKDFLNASWTKDNNGKPQFFIINEAIISKLCILGEDYEPCFEGASIAKIEFSFEDNFKEELRMMMKQVSDLLNKKEGGEKEMEKDFSLTKEAEVIETEASTPAAEPQIDVACEAEFKKKDDKKEEEQSDDASKEDSSKEDSAPEKEADAPKKEEDSSKEDKADTSKDSSDAKEDKSEDKTDSEDSSEDDDKKKKKKQYSLEEEVVEDSKKEYKLEDISEYVELSKNYIKLESEFKALAEEKANLEEEVNSLKEFKLATERKDKEVMINETFYMLSDEDKADVRENIDKYSLDDIEAKLSVICVRNKVFNLDTNSEEKEETPIVFSLEDNMNDSTPAWVSAALEVAKKMK